VLAEPDPLAGPAAQLAAVAAGRGVGVVASALGRLTGAGVAVRPLEPPLTLPLDVVWRSPADPAVQELLRLLACAAP
jgi:DNA-binding transcriptional LysR family regulator